MDCIFCKIINKIVPSNILYEDENVIVFMDANPDANGHILVVPKKHITDMEEMDNETLGHINDVAKEMKKLLFKALNPVGMVMIVNYGCTQMVKHYHLHLIPVYDKKEDILPTDIVYKQIMANKN